MAQRTLDALLALLVRDNYSFATNVPAQEPPAAAPDTPTPGENAFVRQVQPLVLERGIERGLSFRGLVVPPGSDLQGAQLQNADLAASDLSRSNLSGANLAGANLRDADLTDALLTGTNLTNADLAGAIMTGANLEATFLTNANLAGATLTQTQLDVACAFTEPLNIPNGLSWRAGSC